MTPRPVICCLDRDPTDADAHRLTPGSRVVRVADDLGGAPGTMVGVVADHEVDRAVQAAQRGWHLVVRLDLAGENRRLALEDLTRMGHLCDEAALSGRPFLETIDTDLLNRLASGSTLRDAATSVGVSNRTAARRLAALRQALGVSTTAALIAVWRD